MLEVGKIEESECLPVEDKLSRDREDDNQVMDEFSCDYFDIRSTDLLLAQVDALWFRTVGS